MRRELAFERVRATTLRSSWGFPLLGALIALADAVGSTLTAPDGSTGTLGTLVPNSFTFLSVLFLTVPFAQAFGHEYRDGTMRLTLSMFPHRTRIFAAKVAVPAALAALGAALSAVLIAVVFVVGDRADGAAGLLPVLARVVGFTLMWGLLVAALTVLTRNLTAGITGVLIWFLLVEQLLLSLLGSSFEDLDQFMPLANGQRWLSTGDGRSGLVMLVPSVLVLVLALVKFRRQDA